MIELDVPQFCILILVTVAVVVGFGALLDEIRERRIAKEVRRNILRCRICGAAYQKRGSDTVQRCPDCSSLNPCRRDRRLG